MKLVNLIPAALLVLTGSAASAADPQSMTIIAKSDTRYEGDDLKICSIYFVSAFADEDRAYIASGTIGLVRNDEQPGFAPFTKVIVGKRTEDNALPIPISHAVVSGESALSTEDFESVDLANPESPESVMTRYALMDKSKKMVFTELLVGKSIILSFNLGENGKRYSIPVDLTFEGLDKDGKTKNSNTTLKDFHVCSAAMAQTTRSRIGK